LAATVTATSDAKLWALDRESFQMMLTTAENTKSKQHEGFSSSDGGGQGVMAMLEAVESEYSTNIVKMTSEEEAAVCSRGHLLRICLGYLCAVGSFLRQRCRSS